MIGKYPILLIFAAAVGVPLAHRSGRGDYNPDVREAEAAADAAGESIKMTEQHQSGAATNPRRQRTQRRGDRPRWRGGDYHPHRSGQR